MTLTPRDGRITAGPDGVSFTMRDGHAVVTCAHSKAGIDKIFGSLGLTLDLEATFLAHRAIFEKLSNALYEADAPVV